MIFGVIMPFSLEIVSPDDESGENRHENSSLVAKKRKKKC